MATLISCQSGNFTTAGTWKVASAVASAELDSDNNSITLTNTNSDSGTFVLAATNVDAIALKFINFINPTGTLTVSLRNSTTATNVASVTVNCSDLYSTSGLFTSGTAWGYGWRVFSFAAHTPNGTDSYLVRVTRSVADGASDRITLMASTASATNMCRMVRLVTTAAPAAADKLVIAGDFTGAGTNNTFTITMDNTAGTVFGSTTPPQALSVNYKSVFAFGTSASTAYQLVVRGVLCVYADAVFTIGTQATPMPSTSTATLQFAAVGAANVDSGMVFRKNAIFEASGNPITTTKTLLTSDAGATATSITVASTAGWAANDVLWFASTTQTPSQCETKTIQSVNSATNITLTAGLTNAHSGTSPTVGEVAHITRNVKIKGFSTTIQGYVAEDSNATITCRYVEFFQLGSGTGNKRGININNDNASMTNTFEYCSFHDFTVANSIVNFSANATNVTFDNNVFCNNSLHLSVAATTATPTISNNYFIRNTSTSASAVILTDVGLTFTNNTICGNAGTLATAAALGMGENAAPFGTFSGNTLHSNGGGGIYLSTTLGATGTITNLTCWRNANGGGVIIGAAIGYLTFDNLTAFGNNGSNVDILSPTGRLCFNNSNIYGGTTLVAARGISFSSAFAQGITIESLECNSCTFGSPSQHSTGDIVFVSLGSVQGRCTNCLFGSTTEIGTQTNMTPFSVIGSSKHDQTTGSHKAWKKYGVITNDNSIYRTAAPSERLEASSTVDRIQSSTKTIAIASGSAVTVSVYVQIAALSGYPRLIVKRNDAVGITSDTVLDTATAASEGAWEQLTGTTPTATDNGLIEVFVDATGDGSYIYVDDWSAS